MSCTLGDARRGCTGAVVSGSRRTVIRRSHCAGVGDDRQGAIIGDIADALSSVAVGVAESSVVRVTPVTKPEPVGK